MALNEDVLVGVLAQCWASGASEVTCIKIKTKKLMVTSLRNRNTVWEVAAVTAVTGKGPSTQLCVYKEVFSRAGLGSEGRTRAWP